MNNRPQHNIYQRDSKGLIPPSSSKNKQARHQDRQDLYLYLHAILEATEAIEQFLGGIQKEDFLKDELRQSAVIQKLSVIGTAVSGLPQGFFKEYPEINWQAISKLRFVGLHEYFSTIDAAILWVTATKDVKAIRDKVTQILRKIDVNL